MALPGYQEFMFPILKLLSDNKVYNRREIVDGMVKYFNLTEAQLDEKIPSQTEPTYLNRLAGLLHI